MNWQAYNPDWAFHTVLRARAARWQRRGQLSPEQLAAIEAGYPLPYYQPVWPLRVGLFIFTWIGLTMMGVVLALITKGDAPFATGLVCCLACFGVLELVIRERRFYHAGADNALLYAGLGIAAALIAYVFFEADNWNFSAVGLTSGFLPLTLGLIVMLAAVVRYADVLATFVAFITVLVLVLLAVLSIPPALLLLPFVFMATAGATLLGYRAIGRRLAGTALADYYANCLLIVKLLALTLFYLGGNYLVVREGYADLNHEFASTQIPLAPLFYAFTAGIPLLYIVLGLRRADRPTLLLGLLTLAFSFFTLRYYRSLMPPEITAVAGGLVLTVAAGALLRYLRPARFGLTSLPDDEPRHFNLENLIQAQTAHAPGAPAADGFDFGGGQSGGGGATGNF
ncbi:hypothetical protein GCM10022409_27610 [Hymenobacter glaciei]|uniref:DUF2157 domain-containing protein n=1 Tax=Hymenobacter glaciei TaxID=877209 RepID=A0ABP7UC76_9BACT